jgi:Cdc6-like AAA superfamily ATPase
MIVKPELTYNYVGPRALYDDNFIPPKLLHRRKEENNLKSLLDDSMSENFSCNILYQGLKGIGKKVIINKVIKDLISKYQSDTIIYEVNVDCKEKTLEEIIFSLLNDITYLGNYTFKITSLLNFKLSELWNTFKLVMSKISNPLILVFNNIEDLSPSIFKKFLKYSKETKTTLLSTVNRVNRTNTYDILNEFDYKKKLEFYSYSELLDILKQRSMLTFLHEIDTELIEFITDLIFEHYVPVPGKGIEVFKELYPLLKNKNYNQNLDFIEIIQNQFDSLQISDEFSLLTYISEEELLIIIFLDNLANFFLNTSNYYISQDKLEELYVISCESIEYEADRVQYLNIIRNLKSVGIINISKKMLTTKYYSDPIKISEISYFYLIINPRQLKAIVDSIFRKQ